jgi:hypothetical protein
MEEKKENHIIEVNFLKGIFLVRPYYYRIPISVALSILIFDPILLLVQQVDFANEIVMYSYFSLTLGIMWQVIHTIIANQDKKWLTKF